MPELRSPFSSGFSDNEADDLAAAFKVLVSPARLKILHLLRGGTTYNGAQLESFLPLAQPTVTHHLAVLSGAGLITNRREGVFVYRALNTARVRELSRLLDPGWAPLPASDKAIDDALHVIASTLDGEL